MTTAPPPNGGYPIDSDLHQMTDDGCPLVPDPARWVDPVWQDECDRHATSAPVVRPAPALSNLAWDNWMGRWGLATGTLLLVTAVAIGAAAMQWAGGVTLRAVLGVTASLLVYAAIMSVHYFDRTSPAY
jgi:hypothetical protein